MATPGSLEVSKSGELEVLNDVVQLLSWHVLRQYFRRLSDKSEVNFSDILRGVCGVAPPAKLSLRSKLLLKLVSLVKKLQRHEEELELETLQVVVCLLECLQGFPELTENRERLTGYFTEAKCQAVLFCCRNNDEAGASSHWSKYFNSTRKRDPAWSLSSKLNLLVKSLSGDGTLNEVEVKKFFRQHTFGKFQQELLEFLQRVIETLGEPVLYKGMRCQEPFGRAVVGMREGGEEEPMDVGSEGVIGRGEAEDESVAGGSEGEGVVGGSEKEEDREDVAERGNEDAMEGKQNSGSSRGQLNGATRGNGSPLRSTIRMRQIRNRGEGVSEGEAIGWSSDESSEVTTPPSKLPAHHDITVRRRASLLAHSSRTRRIPWTAEEENQLFLGVERYGIGKWTQIRSTFQFNRCRTNVDLKDKWRNLRKH